MASVTEQIRNANAQFMEAFRRQDAPTVARMYSAEARLLPPGAELIAGSGRIENFWNDVMQAGLTDAKLETTDVDLIGGYTAIETGRFTMYAGRNVADRGKYIVIWRNEDGQWKLYRDIWNSNLPSVRHATVGA